MLAAIAAVPRHRFVDTALATQAYEDTSLPIGQGQTISKPSVVARMIELLFGGANARARAATSARVLEIGTGCGYQAARAGRGWRARSYSIERLRGLHDKAREQLRADARGRTCAWCSATACVGHPPGAPYDSIIAAAGGDGDARRPGSSSSPSAAGSSRRCSSRRRRPGAGRRRPDAPTATSRSVHEAVQFVPLKSGLAR